MAEIIYTLEGFTVAFTSKEEAERFYKKFDAPNEIVPPLKIIPYSVFETADECFQRIKQKGKLL